MSKLLAVAEAVALEKLVLGNFPVSRKSKAGLGLVAFSALLALAATGFLIVAFHEWASLNYRADFAALLTALAVFGLSAAAGIGACLIMRQRR